MKKKTFTIFGHTGFIGSHLKKRLHYHKLILPKRGELIFNKNLGDIIYCIGSDLWKKNPYQSFHANLGYVPEIISNNKLFLKSGGKFIIPIPNVKIIKK